MYPALLQDWVTVQSASNDVTQSEQLWLDMSGYLDVVAWLEVKQVSGSFALAYQTCPSKDDSLFQTMNDTSGALAAGVTVALLLRDTAVCPLTKWLRWKLLGGSSSQITFRIWVTASQPGGLALQELQQDQAAYAGPDYVDLGASGGAGAPGSAGLPNFGQLTSLQQKGPVPLAKRNLGQLSSFGHGVQRRQVDYSHPANLNHPRLHGMISTTVDPFWRRRYVQPVEGAVHPVTPEDTHE